MEGHFRKLLTLLQAVQLFDTYSFLLGFLVSTGVTKVVLESSGV